MTPIRVYVVGCGAKKASKPSTIRDLYTGCLFRAARGYVEATSAPWWVLSASYGLIEPHRVAPPYNTTITDAQRDPDHWRRLTGIAAGTLGHSLVHGTYGAQLGTRGRWDPPLQVVVEVHAGAAYVAWLREIVQRASESILRSGGLDVVVEEPLRGLEIGQRLHWYAVRRPPAQLSLFGAA